MLPGQLPLDRTGDRDGLFDAPSALPETKAAPARQERGSAADATDRGTGRAGSKV
jgi:hypothetical protein